MHERERESCSFIPAIMAELVATAASTPFPSTFLACSSMPPAE